MVKIAGRLLRGATVCVLGLALLTAAAQAPPGAAQDGPDPRSRRWQQSFDAFDAADREKQPLSGGVVFVGSSSIRLWNGLENTFDSVPVIQRGFGGSRMADCSENVRRLVLPYKPRLVVVYAGDNDLAEGDSPQDVLTSFRAFVAGVHETLPQTRIAYISIKPSPRRAALLPKVREANTLIQRYAAETANLDYIDVFTPMLDVDGQPRTDLYGPDRLHMNSAGYAMWKTVIAGHLGLERAAVGNDLASER